MGMIADVPLSCSKWLSLADWWYNTTHHSSILCTPFEVLYGYRPPLHQPYFPKNSLVASVDKLLQDSEEMLYQDFIFRELKTE